MANYTYSQLEGLWQQAGGSAALAPTMAAIALAESSGNPNAVGPVGEHGLWQIYGKAWPGMDTFDPLGNAKSAVTVQSKQGLSAWSTYTNGAYKAYLANGVAATLPPGASGSPASGSAAGSGVSTASSLTPSASLDPTCLIGIPSISGGALSLGLSSPSICFVSKKMARQIVGGMLIAASLVGGVVALAVIYRQQSPGAATRNLMAIQHNPSPPPVYEPGDSGAPGPGGVGSMSEYRKASARSGSRPRKSSPRRAKRAAKKSFGDLAASASIEELPELAVAAV